MAILKYKNDESQLLKKFPLGTNGNKFISSPIEHSVTIITFLG